MTLYLLLLLACGRETEDVDARLVGVGLSPEEIGPAPEPFGGVVEYSYVDLAGGGLSLAHMGLGSFSEIGPGMIGFAPPYAGIIGFSYLFDQQLPAADTYSFVVPAPPVAEDTCYTVVEPQGPIGSFTTLDVGDYMEFVAPDGSAGFRMSRIPADYPPDPQNLFIYYSSVEEYAPYARTHLVPGDSNDPKDMTEKVYRNANYPFGTEMLFRFPGGVSRFDQPVGSIPRPSSSVGDQTVRLPADLGGVLFEWQGPRFDAQGAVLSEGAQTTCLEFYPDGRPIPATYQDCETPPALPTDGGLYDSFPGQIYTAPWDTEGGLALKWSPDTANGDQVIFSVRFMAPIDLGDPNFLVPKKDGRDALACEEDTEWEVAEYLFDPELADEDIPVEQKLNAALKGDPFSKMVEVSCLLADDGEHTLDASLFADALHYAQTHEVGGVIFFFARGTETEVTVPAAKDQYDQRHDITPIKVTARATRVGRFHWSGNVDAAGGAE